ncbi:SGNH hydrolase, partial [Hyaloscypha hepaticicola]
RPRAISMMVVGDSISQGGEGDWTWRYRLWEWFKVQDVVVDFVGPFLGTRPQAIDKNGYNNEIDPEFNPRHFTAVGRALWQDINLISPMVARYNPDYLLVLLGFNDMAWQLGWHEATIHGDTLLANMEIFIARARAAKPDIKFVIGNVPQRAPLAGDLFLMTSDYNRLLAEAIPKWSTETSPIELADLGASYRCETDECPSTFDGLHPSPLGDYQIARAFSRALIKGFKIGTDELAVPDPADLPQRAFSIPTNTKVMIDTKWLNITWNLFYGAKGYNVQSRVLG